MSAEDVSGFGCNSTNRRWNVASVTVSIPNGTLVNVETVSAPSIGVHIVNLASTTLQFDGNGHPIDGNPTNSNAIGTVLDNTLQSTVTTLGQLTEPLPPSRNSTSTSGKAKPISSSASRAAGRASMST